MRRTDTCAFVDFVPQAAPTGLPLPQGSAFSDLHRAMMKSGSGPRLSSREGGPWCYMGYRYSSLTCKLFLFFVFVPS